MKTLDITFKDLLQMLRDWKAAFFLIAMPIAFTMLFGFIFGGTSNTAQDTRLPVGYIDQDQGQLGSTLLGLLGNSEVIKLTQQKEGTDLNTLVANEKLVAAVIIPAGYSAAALAGETAKLMMIVDATSNPGISAQNEVQAAANRLLSAVHTAQISVQTHEKANQFADDAARQAYFDQGLQQTLAAWENPPFKIEVKQAVIKTEQQNSNGFAHASPGMMAQFAIAGLISAATVIVLERKGKVLQRLLTTSTSRVEILVGHFLAIFILIAVQFLFLTGFGQLFLGLNYYGEAIATLLLIAATATFTASLGLLIGVLAATEEQVVVLTLVPMFVLAGLGGAWVPLEITPKAVQIIGHFLPVAWMMDGFKGILLRGWGVAQVLQPVGVLLAFTVLCLGIAIWRFRYE